MAMTKQQFENWKVKLKEYKDKATCGKLYDKDTGCYCALGVLCISEGIDFDYEQLRQRFGWDSWNEFDHVEKVYGVNDEVFDQKSPEKTFPKVIKFLDKYEHEFVGAPE
jgi:hypothetical protein